MVVMRAPTPRPHPGKLRPSVATRGLPVSLRSTSKILADSSVSATRPGLASARISAQLASPVSKAAALDDGTVHELETRRRNPGGQRMQRANEQEIREFIIETFLFGNEQEGLGPDDSLIANRVIDSTGILEVVAFLESRFGIHVADEDMRPANFDTIRGIAGFLERKREAA